VKYRTIVADPPWPYRSADGGMLRSSANHRPNSWDSGRNNPGVAGRYDTLSIHELQALPVSDLANRDAHLYLWATNAFMVEAHQLAEAWGFEQKTIITWGKVHQNDHLTPSMKTGFYYRGATEHVLFCVRGSQRLNGTWPTLFLWPRVGTHSSKPDAFYDLVEQASPGPWVELFARRHRMGWDVWGDESANTATLETPA
jgi:N6-adenosine-specific RNA methylase IME4